MILRVGGVDQLAPLIRDAVDSDSPHDALRWIAEFIWDVEHVEQSVRADLLGPRPDGTTSPAWDAVIAGVVEMLAHRHGLKVPPWTARPDLFLETWWFFSDLPAWQVSAFTNAPAALANRGVFIHAAALESV